MFRHWRIQFSIICLALLAATLVMWVRSYYWIDGCSCQGTQGRLFFLYSYEGEVRFFKDANIDILNSLHFQSLKMDDHWKLNLSRTRPFQLIGLYVSIQPPRWSIVIPFWSLTALCGAIAGLPWYWQRIPFKFSLRTMLIATTVVAAALGLIVWASR